MIYGIQTFGRMGNGSRCRCRCSKEQETTTAEAEGQYASSPNHLQVDTQLQKQISIKVLMRRGKEESDKKEWLLTESAHPYFQKSNQSSTASDEHLQVDFGGNKIKSTTSLFSLTCCYAIAPPINNYK